MEQPETQKPLQITACKGFWDIMEHHEMNMWLLELDSNQ
jgi:hypothetical protein